MSKKNSNLLGESQIRRMMGLAGIPSVNESEFIDTYRKTYFEEEEEAPEAGAEEVDMEAGAEEPVEGEPAAIEPDAPADEPNVETLVQALAQTITDVTGVQVDADGGAAAEPAAEEPEMEMGAEADPAAEPAAEEPEMEMAEGGKYKREDKEEEGEEEEEKVEETLAKALAAAGLQLELDNDEMVAEITKRVAARLVRESRKK